MFPIFRSQPSPPVGATFNTRVQQFWDWYAQVAPRFYQTIEAGQCASLASEVSAKVDEWFPGFAWVFGPGEGGGHSFTLTGEGNLHRQLLTIFWHSQAPRLSGWTFYPARQPGSIAGKHIRIGERDFDPIEFWLVPSVNQEVEKVDITVWHPLFDILNEQERWTVLFLFLDEVLGEYGTDQWIGKVELNNRRLADAIPLQELGGFLKKIEVETGWKKLPPGEAGVIYKLEQPHNRFPRGDILVGSTSHLKLINEYVEAEGKLPDPLAGTGADYVFASFDVGFLPQGKQSEARGVIADALDSALKSAASGRLLGGAHGQRFAYIDLLLFDGKASLEIVQRIMREQKVPAGCSINFFAQEKRAQRIVL